MASATNLVYGVGINDADYPLYKVELINGKRKVTWTCPFYRRWKNLLQRCYSQKSLLKRPTYFLCSMDKEWHSFMTFRSWMIQQDWEGKDLDKDLLFPGNKVYSSETCIFVDRRVNNFLVGSDTKENDLPRGVCSKNGKFYVQCHDVLTNKQVFLGYFKNPDEGHRAWLKYKVSQAHILAAEQTDSRVAAALIDRYENYHIYFPQPR